MVPQCGPASLKAETVPNSNHIAGYSAAYVVNKKFLNFFADQEVT